MKDIIYIDISIDGTKTQSGDIEEVINDEALNNAFRIWLVSTRGDNLRRISGGYLIPHIGKAMNRERALLIQQAIEDGLKQDFSPALEIITLDVVPDYIRRLWEIKLVAFSPDLKIGLNTIEKIRSFTK